MYAGTLEEAVIRAGFRVEDIPRLLIIGWLPPGSISTVEPPKFTEDGRPYEAGPPDDRVLQDVELRAQRHPPHDPVDMAAAEARWREGVERRAREVIAEKLHDHFQKHRQRGV